MKKSVLSSQRLCKDIFILLLFCCSGIPLIGVSWSNAVAATGSDGGSDVDSGGTGQKKEKRIRGEVQKLQGALPMPNPDLIEGFEESAANWKEIRENKKAAEEAEKGLLEEEPVKPEKKSLPKSLSPVVPSSKQKTATEKAPPYNPSQEPKTPLKKSGPFKRKRTDSLHDKEMSSKTGSFKRKRPAVAELENQPPTARKKLKISKEGNPPKSPAGKERPSKKPLSPKEETRPLRPSQTMSKKPKSFAPKFSTPKRSVSSMRIPSPRKIK